ncbi:MAG: type II secretion system F family protein [Clostridia bacterium]|nr:type II secretion system F family protein [Clostridia bacterium]
MSGLQISAIILAVVIGLFNFFLAASIAGTATEDKRAVRKRVKAMQKKPSARINKEKRKESILQRAKGASQNSRSSRQRKLMDSLFDELVSAEIMMRPEEFALVWIIATFVPAGLAALFGAGMIPAATLAGLGAFLPILYIKIKKEKRTKVFESQLGDTLIMMCNSLRSGFSFQQAMDSVASDMPAPVGVEFARACNEIRYGATLDEALENMTDRVKSPDLMLVVSAVCIQRTTGGNLSEILTTISETIRDRLKIKGEIRSITAQGRTSGMIIGALPVMIAVALMLINPDYMNSFFTTAPGRVMLSVSVVMEIIGFLGIKKVVTIKY